MSVKNKLDDLTDQYCAKEPIHIPGAIQSHAILLVLDPETLNIIQVSKNISSIINTPAVNLISKNIASLPIKDITPILELGQKQKDWGYLNPVEVKINEKAYNLTIHNADNLLILEIEPYIEKSDVNKIQHLINNTLKAIQQSEDLQKLSEIIVKHIKEITGYDRVMLYRFHRDWHGEVIAEAREDFMDSYLGLHFPSTDIPEQARDLYFMNDLRMISDVNSDPSPIIPTKIPALNRPIDLSSSVNRAVSPIHIKYLQNMNVQASLSIAVIEKEKLWGLIACHHNSAKFLDYTFRNTCNIIGKLFSSALETKLEYFDKNFYKTIDQNRQLLYDKMLLTKDIPDSLLNHKPSIKDINSSGGAALIFENKIYSIGNVPSKDFIKNITTWLKSSDFEDIVSFTRLIDHLPEAKEFSDVAAGLLVVTISKEADEYALWFKPELITEVHWSGNPDKPVELDSAGQMIINPRKSFEKWTNEVKDSSEPWKKSELLVAEKFYKNISQIISQKAIELRKLHEHLMKAYEELDAFSYTISHDLKSPLTTIRSFSEILLDDHFRNADEEARMILDRIIKGVDKMDNLIMNVLQYSRAGRENSAFEKLNIQKLVTSIKNDILSTPGDQKIEINVGNLPEMWGEPTMITQLFSNVILNAVKYSSAEEVSKVNIDAHQNGNKIIYTIEDNGIGIDEKYHSEVFELFKRMDNASDFEGSGIGLAIAKRIAHIHHGDITFKSSLGKGTTFSFIVPASNDNPQ